jgi:hypothetical protein
MALIMTKSPMVLVPLLIPVTHSTIVAVRPIAKIVACPALSTASET